MALKRQITEMHRDKDGKINVFTIDPVIEQTLADSVQNTKQGLMLAVDPAMAETLLERIGTVIEKQTIAGNAPLCICSPNIRLAFHRLVEAKYPGLAVISYNEVLPHVEVVSSGMVRLQDGN